MADWGEKVSQPTFNVKTAAPKDLVESSTFNMLKTSSAPAAVTGPTSIAHGLSYTPVFFTTVIVSGKGSIIGNDFNSTMDATNINISANTVKYYIFFQQGV